MFRLAIPWLLLLLPLPWLVNLFWKRAQLKSATALKIPFYQNILRIQTFENTVKESWYGQKILPWLIWILLVIAASGPEWLGPTVDLPRAGRNIMLAVDLSGSMQIPDMTLQGHAVDRLTLVKNAASEFINSRVGDRLGLILFGSRAYLQTPLTFDHVTVAQMLDDATIGLAGLETAIGDAIGLAIKQLQRTPEKSRILILLTDGGNNSGMVLPLDAAKIAAQAGIKIYTIGLGADRLLINGLFGPQVINADADLDQDTLKQISKMTGGVFFRAENSQDLYQVYRTLDTLEPIDSDQKQFQPIEPLYQWPLGLALLLSVYLAGRKLSYGPMQVFGNRKRKTLKYE